VPKDFLVLAGRPGMGKSTAAWGVVLDACIRQSLPTLVFSTEMTAVDVARWIGSMRFGVHQDLLTPEQWEATLTALSKSPVTICDAAAVSVTDIVAIAESMPATKLVIVDHLQRLRWGQERNTAIEEGCALLKSLAKDNDLTMLALSQLNRSSAYEKRQPNLHDLRDSGGIEQEADAVCFLWTDAEDTTAVDLSVKFFWGKNRHGRIVQRDAIFHKVTKRYEAVDECDRIRNSALQAKHMEQVNRLLGEKE
jgi:replicative DNA helicase